MPPRDQIAHNREVILVEFLLWVTDWRIVTCQYRRYSSVNKMGAKMRTYIYSLFLGVVGLSVGTGTVTAQQLGPDDPCPKPEIQDTKAAITTPDEYAWRMFVEINQPGELTTKCQHPTRSFGSDGPVLWETWRNVRSEADPGPWRGRATPPVRTRLDVFPKPLQLLPGRTPREMIRQRAMGEFADEVVGEGNEARMNRDAYLFVRENKLYDRRVQMASAASGTFALNLPLASKEIKAQWRKIDAADKGRYHWVEFQKTRTEKEIWGLTALHIISKDLPNWFWATFEHVDNRIPDGQLGGRRGNEGWKRPSLDRFACPDAPLDCDRVPQGMGLQGTAWENYRLRGTQVDFVTSIGKHTRLASSQMEQGNQESSCITCHALATIDKDGEALGFGRGLDGAPDPSQFMDPVSGKQSKMQLDFMWSLVFGPVTAEEIQRAKK
jgi:hypothetical protein